MVFFSHKFWMGFNSFVLLFLAVNISTIGVEVKSGIPFLIALCYLIYMSMYLSKSALWKVQTLIGIGITGALFYLVGMIAGMTSSNLYPLAWTHIVLSCLLTGGSFAHLISKN
jgi:hypothetical protein